MTWEPLQHMTPELHVEALKLMGLGYSVRHAASVLNVHAGHLAKLETGRGDDAAIDKLEHRRRTTRCERIAANIAAYPSVSLFCGMERAA